jgi:hypothetical protein
MTDTAEVQLPNHRQTQKRIGATIFAAAARLGFGFAH